MKFLILLLVVSCTSLKYVSDDGFVLPTTGGSLESLVFIDSMPCKDMEGMIGVCTKRLVRDRDLEIELPPRDYAYNVNVTCSANINFSNNYDVPEKSTFTVKINKDLYDDEKQFFCIGSIAPMDRGVVTHKFEIRVRLVDTDYIKRNNITVYEKGSSYYLITGQYAKYVQVFKDGKWKYYNKKPFIKVKKKDLKKIKVISESESGRLNYFNM